MVSLAIVLTGRFLGILRVSCNNLLRPTQFQFQRFQQKGNQMMLGGELYLLTGLGILQNYAPVGLFFMDRMSQKTEMSLQRCSIRCHIRIGPLCRQPVHQEKKELLFIRKMTNGSRVSIFQALPASASDLGCAVDVTDRQGSLDS